MSVAARAPRAPRRAELAPDPTRVRVKLLRWFGRGSRDFFWREGPSSVPLTRFQVLLVELLLWRTSAPRSEAVIRDFVLRHPSPRHVMARTVEELEREIRPLGLHGRRSRCLATLSRQLVEEHGGEVPDDPRQLQRLMGIGQYAARATACVLAGSRLMPVDVNTARIFGRLFGEEGPGVRTPSPAWDARLDAFVPRREPKRFLWAVMDLAAAHCSVRAPRCGGCPLRGDCSFARTGGASVSASEADPRPGSRSSAASR